MELAKVTLSDCHLALIDEPTNHMDYVAKNTFIDWLETAQQSVVVITHDRDVLASVDRIIEIKDSEALSFVGNYDAYLKQNSHTTLNAMQQYEFDLRTLENLHGQVMEARRKKNKAAGLSAVRFRKMEDRLQRQYDALSSTIQKPSLWIDAKGLEDMQDKTAAKYDKYKAKNIRISTQASKEGDQVVVEADDLSLGYGKPLFSQLSFKLQNGERLHLNGRNGVGKTTLVNAVLAASGIVSLDSKIYSGTVIVEPATRIGLYEQEIGSEYLDLTLSDAIARAFREHKVAVSDQKVMQAMSDYLFNPSVDGRLEASTAFGWPKSSFSAD